MSRFDGHSVADFRNLGHGNCGANNSMIHGGGCGVELPRRPAWLALEQFADRYERYSLVAAANSQSKAALGGHKSARFAMAFRADVLHL